MAFAPRPLQDIVLTAELDDVSTTSSSYVMCPTNGEVDKLYFVLHGATSVANTELFCSIAGTAITGGNVDVVYSGSAAGDTYSATPTAAKAIREGQRLDFATSGASTTAARATLTAIIRRS
jgi:hypothetical protein